MARVQKTQICSRDKKAGSCQLCVGNENRVCICQLKMGLMGVGRFRNDFCTWQLYILLEAPPGKQSGTCAVLERYIFFFLQRIL